MLEIAFAWPYWQHNVLKRLKDHRRLGPNSDDRCSATTNNMRCSKACFGDSVTSHSEHSCRSKTSHIYVYLSTTVPKSNVEI